MSKLVLNKLAFVTGAASGIGRATCKILAREGAKVIAADKNEKGVKQVISELSGQHLGIELSVDQASSVKTALESIIKHYNEPPSVIVNCAGITRDNFILSLSEKDFDEVLNVNLKGTFLVTQTFANAMVQNGIKNGTIINIASIVGKYGNIGQSNYCASKAGVELLTKTASREFGKFGIRCNSILPGFVETPMTNLVPDKVKAKIIPLISLGRFGNPDEVAEVITFLASERASYVNGASIEVAGGF